MRRGMWIALCAAGCLREPTFNGRDAPIDAAVANGGVVMAAANGGVTVMGALDQLRYQASFATTGLHFLDGLSLDGTALLGHDGSVSCNAEDEAGIAVFPAERISQRGPATLQMSTANIALTGPAAGQVSLAWQTEYQCGTTPKLVTGASTFTFFPDGRIVRFEDFYQDRPGMPAIADCACEPATQWFPTVFIALDAGAFTNLAGEALADGPIPDSTAEPSQVGRYACAYTTGRQFAIAWPDPQTRIRRPTSGSTATLAFVYDLTTDHATMPPEYGFATRATMFLDDEPAGCTRATMRAAGHVAPASLLVNSAPVGLTSIDGIYGGQERGSMVAGVFAAGNVTLQAGTQGPIPDGFAVWLTWDHAVTPVPTRTPPDPGGWYLVQQPTAQSAIFWFRHGLVGNARIDIRVD